MRKFGFSWSFKRAIGITAVKQRIARKTGIPTTRAGRQRKIGRLVGGFLWPLALFPTRRRGSTSPPPQAVTWNAPVVPPSNAWASVGLALSLLGIVSCGLTSPLGCLFSMIGLCQPRRGSAGAGFLLGALGSAWLAMIVLFVAASIISGPSVVAQQAKSQGSTPAASVAVDSQPASNEQPDVAVVEPELDQVTSSSAPVEPIDDRFRTWKSADGQFSTEATFLWAAAGAVKLQKKDGKVITVPVSQLSDSDQQWIHERATAQGAHELR